eukprot:sb/3479665/
MNPCDLCEKEFTTVYLLLQHQKYYHLVPGPGGIESSDENTELKTEKVLNEEPLINSRKDNEENQIDLEYEEDDIEEDDIEEKSGLLKDIDLKALYRKRDQQARKYERLYKSKLSETKQHLERILLFEKQLDEFRTKFNDSKFYEFSDTIINSKNIRDYLELRRLMDMKGYASIVRSNRLVKAIKSLFIGLKYGAVPLVVPQRKRLSAKGRKLINLVDCKSLEEIKRLLLKYSKDFYNIFQIIGRTLSLVASLEYEK